jgi:hypothetical protein
MGHPTQEVVTALAAKAAVEAAVWLALLLVAITGADRLLRSQRGQQLPPAVTHWLRSILAAVVAVAAGYCLATRLASPLILLTHNAWALVGTEMVLVVLAGFLAAFTAPDRRIFHAIVGGMLVDLAYVAHRLTGDAINGQINGQLQAVVGAAFFTLVYSYAIALAGLGGVLQARVAHRLVPRLD